MDIDINYVVYSTDTNVIFNLFCRRRFDVCDITALKKTREAKISRELPVKSCTVLSSILK